MSWIFRSVIAGLAVASVPVLASACGSSAPPDQAGSASSSTSGGGGGGAPPVYGTSECGICVEKTACVSQVNACKGDPGCSTYLDCLDACPLGPTGDADTACEKACPAISGSAGQAAKEALITCRTSGLGATTCPECGQVPACTNPIFEQTCSASTETNKCFICEDEHCCDGYTNCLADQSCLDLQMCIKTCAAGPSAMFAGCEGQCYMDHPAGFANYSKKLACIVHFCADEGQCGDKPLDPCVKCMNLQCCDKTAACQQDLQCQLLETCQTPCAPTDTACFTACEAKFPDGKAILYASLACALDHCDIACGGTAP